MTSGFLEKRDSNGNILSSFGPFIGIQHLTLDEYAKLGAFDTTSTKELIDENEVILKNYLN